MPTPGMAIDMVIDKRLEKAVKERFANQKDRENAWRFFDYARNNMTWVCKLSSLMAIFTSVVVVFAGMVSRSPEFNSLPLGLLMTCVAFVCWYLGDFFERRAVHKIKALIATDQAYWMAMQRWWEATWLQAGRDIFYFHSSQTPIRKQTSVKRYGDVILLVRFPF